jgi:uncharacterized protein
MAAPCIANCPLTAGAGRGRLKGAIMSYTVDTGVRVPMRDRTELDTNVWRPAGEGPWPTLLVRLPYGKDLPALLTYGTNPNVFELVEAGYAVVFQDCRGTFKSEGLFEPMVHEAEDGADTVAWLLARPWCDGSIGSYGPSYLGFVQWQRPRRVPRD